ncbi:uroporphyrinogen-III synthase [Qingshengfaniella alkalisoli]|uniref:Uroporphyrinogen-III synthase n=1 Tax=Qingshengfaniella alkalisoli TaxID=2599296 RepID=A0A5B8J1Z4_9RHOB|nr:uroporphyrinogen-III synthase [Qingshengfaniella alkalisoli]QDY68250.1 uroporphyrinogen-III synthase [Qingshengfaniella alkalisoli]
MHASRLLLTRPRVQAERFARDCRLHLNDDLAIEISPVLEIEPVDSHIGTDGVDALVFTSENAVCASLAVDPSRTLVAFCVGEHTASAAMEAGWQARSAGGAKEELAALLRSQPRGRTYLHLRGETVAGSLAKLLSNTDLRVLEHIVYRQRVIDLTSTAKMWLDSDAPILLPLFSPRTARTLAPALRGATAPLRIATISQNVVRELEGLHDACLVVADSPDAAAILSTLRQLQDRTRLEGPDRPR